MSWSARGFLKKIFCSDSTFRSQEKEITRLGSTKTIKLDFRVVCASNQDLDVMVRQGLFKEDLLQRLNVQIGRKKNHPARVDQDDQTRFSRRLREQSGLRCHGPPGAF